MSSSLWVPPAVSRELRESTEQHRAEVIAQAIRDATLAEWTRRLKQLDPYLELIKAKDDATAPGMIPGYYHVLRHNPGAPPSLLPVTGPDGEFVEPTEQLLDMLRAGDLQNERAMEDRRRKDEEQARRREAERQRDTEDRQAEILERWKAATQTSVSMNRDTPWAQNAAGLKRRRG